MFRKKDVDEEIEIAAQRVLLGWKAAGQPINIVVQDRETSDNSIENSKGMLLKVAYEKKKVMQNPISLDSLLSLANSIV